MDMINAKITDVIVAGGRAIGLIITTDGKNRLPAWIKGEIPVFILGTVVDISVEWQNKHIIIHKIVRSKATSGHVWEYVVRDTISLWVCNLCEEEQSGELRSRELNHSGCEGK